MVVLVLNHLFHRRIANFSIYSYVFPPYVSFVQKRLPCTTLPSVIRRESSHSRIAYQTST